MKISGSAFSGYTLLCGERNTKKVEGFTLGNSPLEYTKETISGKSIILYTTNGSKAIVKAKFSENTFTCSFNNLGAVAKHLAELGKDFEIVCSGSNGMFSLEDAVCAGKLIAEISKTFPDVELSDASIASVILNDTFGGEVAKMLRESEHGKLLMENGFDTDIDVCAELSIIDIIPSYVSGTIKKLDA